MPYSEFTTLRKVREQFGVTIAEAAFLSSIDLVAPSSLLTEFLVRYRSRALDINTEKARSELMIAPILFELEALSGVTVFSGRNFDVDPTVGLNGYVDFVVSQSPLGIEIEAPVVAIVEAKMENINAGLGQCIATMLGALQFNANQQNANRQTQTVYGAVTTGDRWRFLMLKETQVTIDVDERLIPPVDLVLGILAWMTSW